MEFCTVINCMDGRVQLPVIKFMQKRFNAEYVDSITEAGPNLILSEGKNIDSIQGILNRLEISVKIHNSIGIGVVGHHDCAGNPTTQDIQIAQIHTAIKLLRQHYKSIDIIGLWIDKNWEVHEVAEILPSGRL